MKIIQPKISVLMPVYNCEKFLKEAIDSILNQTFDNLEYIIINDGSTDNSLNIINSYKDKRIKIINNSKNIGISRSLNKGISHATGKFIARQDADDISELDRMISHLGSSVFSTLYTLLFFESVGRRLTFVNNSSQIISRKSE